MLTLCALGVRDAYLTGLKSRSCQHSQCGSRPLFGCAHRVAMAHGLLCSWLSSPHSPHGSCCSCFTPAHVAAGSTESPTPTPCFTPVSRAGLATIALAGVGAGIGIGMGMDSIGLTMPLLIRIDSLSAAMTRLVSVGASMPVLIPIASLVESLKEWIAPSYACPLWIYSCPSSFELTLSFS